MWQTVKKTVSGAFSSPDHIALKRSFSNGTTPTADQERCNNNQTALVSKKVEELKENEERGPDETPRTRARRILSNVNNESILHFAATENDVALLKRILEQSKVDINFTRPPGSAPLHQACIMGNLDCAKVLVQYEADVNMKDWRGKTPLELAVCNGNYEVAEYLIQKGALVDNIKDGFQSDKSKNRRRSRSALIVSSRTKK